MGMQRDKDRRLVSPVAGSELRLLDTPPLWPPRLKAHPASETAAWVLANAGARAWERDAIDLRLIEEAKTGGGKIIDFESEVGGLPRYRASKNPRTADIGWHRSFRAA